MSKVIIYKQQDGNLSIVTPINDEQINELAASYVPKGKPYKVIDSYFLPEDKIFRDAWTIDDLYLDDGYGTAEP